MVLKYSAVEEENCGAGGFGGFLLGFVCGGGVKSRGANCGWVLLFCGKFVMLVNRRFSNWC